MSKLGNEIHRIRSEFLTSFIPIFKKFYNEIAMEEENVKIGINEVKNSALIL